MVNAIGRKYRQVCRKYRREYSVRNVMTESTEKSRSIFRYTETQTAPFYAHTVPEYSVQNSKGGPSAHI